jgi:hypothetical protein
MRPVNILLLILFFGCVFSSTGSADIYVWTDDDGVKHFTNYAPPADAQLLMKTKEIPYDEQADRERRETEEQQKQAMAEKEAVLAEQQQAEKRMAEDRRRAEQILRQAEALLDTATADNDDYNNSYVSYGYYPYHYLKYRHYHPWYYRQNGSIYYLKPHPLNRRHPADRHVRRGLSHHLRIHTQTPGAPFNTRSGNGRLQSGKF